MLLEGNFLLENLIQSKVKVSIQNLLTVTAAYFIVNTANLLLAIQLHIFNIEPIIMSPNWKQFISNCKTKKSKTKMNWTVCRDKIILWEFPIISAIAPVNLEKTKKSTCKRNGHCFCLDGWFIRNMGLLNKYKLKLTLSPTSLFDSLSKFMLHQTRNCKCTLTSFAIIDSTRGSSWLSLGISSRCKS